MTNGNSMDSRFKESKLSLASLSVYRQLLKDTVIGRLYDLLDYLGRDEMELGGFINIYNDFFYALACTSAYSLKEYIIDSILFSENPYSMSIQDGSSSHMKVCLESAAASDLNNLQIVSDISAEQVKNYAAGRFGESRFEDEIILNLPQWEKQGSRGLTTPHIAGIRDRFLNSESWSECINDLSEFHGKHGCGMFARFNAFVWEHQDGRGSLKGIETPDPVTLSDLIGYEMERFKIIENTIQFLGGFPANNVLIYGDRGTGKSSTVKALLNEYDTKGLRIIEVPKKHLADFPQILRCVRGRPLKFIIFVDDLAFEDNEESYTALKAVLEGGLESKPDNVLIYATSNRRHLVKEQFSERAGINSGSYNDEVYAGDTMQEKLSLSDRFGITVVFSSPDKKRYLEIVVGMAARRGLDIDREKLHNKAMEWELWYNGRSPRTARQFIDWIEGNEGINRTS